MHTEEKPAITLADKSRSGYIEIDFDILYKQALQQVTNIITIQVLKRFNKFKTSQSKIDIKQYQKSKQKGNLIITLKQGVSWVRYAIDIYVDMVGIEDWKPQEWAAQIDIYMEDCKNLLLPRSKIQLKQKSSRIYKYDFALTFNERFKDILNYYQALVQLDWTKVSLLDLLRMKVERFLQKQGFKM